MTFPEQTDIAVSYYGTLAGVQAFLKPTITLSASSPVTSTDVTDALDALSASLDVRLGAAGYATPVTGAEALNVLDSCADRLVAADALERLIIGRNPEAGRVKVAEVWRKQAEDVLALIFSGAATLPGATRLSTYAIADTPAVSSAASKFPTANTDEFVDAHGGAFSGGPV